MMGRFNATHSLASVNDIRRTDIKYAMTTLGLIDFPA
jgi:hypothetical protein